ncbi:UNKNOWN [Stylonychia lemnae]|uniref:Uncharacterized protein n=1 Tax=Stylonychia lemnae TaxID=5949 RepID=A0A078AX46_STYLE|nr:UNKNOWN [Stylonychia lemnae]|eukprot:CDW86739.1 UNKNOWN [Stylonychia lemnae]
MKNRKRKLKRRKNSSNHFPKYNLILHCSSHQVKLRILNLGTNFLLVDRTRLRQDQNQIKHSNTFSTQQQKLPVQQLQHSQTSTMFGSLSQSPIQTDPFKDGTFATPQTNKNSQTYLQSSSQTGAFALGQKLIQPQLKSSTKIIGSQQTLPLQNQPSNFSFSQPQIQADQAQNKSQAIPIAKSQLAPQQLTQQQQIQQQNNTQQSIPLSQQPIQVQISQQAMVKSKQKTSIQVQIEDFEKKMTDHYNKEVVDLLKQIRVNLPSLQSHYDDLRANNVKMDILYQQLRKFEIYKEDFGLQFHEGQRLKDLLVLDDFREDKKLQFTKAQKYKLATIDDKSLDILERIKSQEEKSSNSYELNEPIQRLSKRVISQQSNALKQQPQNNLRYKFLSRGDNTKGINSNSNLKMNDPQQNLEIVKDLFEIKKNSINETIQSSRIKQQEYFKQVQENSEKTSQIRIDTNLKICINNQSIKQLTQKINYCNSKLYKDQ